MEDEGMIQEDEEIIEKKGKDFKYFLMATKFGTIKKTQITEYEGIRKNGVIAIKLEKEDELIWVKPTDGKSELMLVTDSAQAIRFHEKEIRETGRSSVGVRGIRVREKEQVVGMDIVRKNEGYVLIVMDRGYGKMSKLEEYQPQGRGGRGVLTARITPKTGTVISMRIMDHPNRELLIISQQGQTIRLPINTIPTLGRTTSGVRLIKLQEDDKVAEVACI
jgi:DNA gyrase subunit A